GAVALRRTTHRVGSGGRAAELVDNVVLLVVRERGEQREQSRTIAFGFGYGGVNLPRNGGLLLGVHEPAAVAPACGRHRPIGPTPSPARRWGTRRRPGPPGRSTRTPPSAPSPRQRPRRRWRCP